MPSRRTPRKQGCENCRIRHVKCDNADPCGQCSLRGKDCVRGVRFRHFSIPGAGPSGEARYDFADDQRWCRTSTAKPIFIDETLELSNIYDTKTVFDSDDEADGAGLTDWKGSTAPKVRTPENPSAREAASTGQDDAASLDENLPEAWSRLSMATGPPNPDIATSDFGSNPSYHVHSEGHQEVFPLQAQDSHGIFTQSDTLENPIVNNTPYDRGNGPERLRPSYDDHAVPSGVSSLPLRSRYEAGLVCHFVSHLAPAFDIGSEEATFENNVTRMAAKCPLLLNAVMAVSAKHLGDAEPAAEYYQNAMQYLSDPDLSTGLDESIGIGAVLLDFHNNIQVPILPEREKGSPLIHDVLASQSPSTMPSGSHQFILDAALFQEIYDAVMRQAPLETNTNGGVQQPSKYDENRAWVNRMALHLADVVQYCFGATQNLTAYEQLVEFSTLWLHSRSISAPPMFFNQPIDETIFPEIHLLGDSSVVEVQYYHLVRILLTAHNPTIPRLGKARIDVAKAIDEQMRSDVKIICGLAESFDDICPAHLIACMGIALAGDRFTEKAEQHALLEILLKTTRAYGWCTSIVQKQLMEAWSWETMNEDPG